MVVNNNHFNAMSIKMSMLVRNKQIFIYSKTIHIHTKSVRMKFTGSSTQVGMPFRVVLLYLLKLNTK